MSGTVIIQVDENSSQSAKDFAAAAAASALEAQLAKPIETITPADVPDGVGVRSWNAVEPGAYPNCGGIVIPENCFAIIKRDAAGAFSFTKTVIELGSYAKKLDQDSISDEQKINAGVNFFTIVGYVKETTRAVVANLDFKCTPFLRFTSDTELVLRGIMAVGAEFRQVMFYSSNTDESYISPWTTNDNEMLTINSSNVPVGTKYIRLNSYHSYSPEIILNGVKNNAQLDKDITSSNLDVFNNTKVKLGVDLFTIAGYVHKTTGIPDTNAGFKHTDYLSLELIEEIKVENLGVAGAFRQATFFSSKSPDGIISSYTADSASTIVLNKTNIPSTAKYVIFNTYIEKNPIISLGKKNYKAASPVNTLLGKASWKNINAATGYSDYWGQYWNGSSFVSDNNFNGQLYDVSTIDGVGAIHVRGWFYGNMPMVVFFMDQSLTSHVANGEKNGTIAPAYYDFYENVPAEANYALVQQSRTGHASPFVEMVEETTIVEEKKKIILMGDSLTQMSGYADELMGCVKELDPSYDVYNYGIGGEKTVEIAGRAGAFQMFLEPEDTYLTPSSVTGVKYFELPATTAPVNIGANAISNSWNATKLNLLRQNPPILDCRPNNVWIDGIECLLTWTGSTYTLNRLVAGSAAHNVFYGTQMIPVNSLKTNPNDIVVLNFGQNGGFSNTADLIAQYQRVIDSLSTKKYIILSSHYAQDTDAEASTFIVNRIEQEAALKKAFGAKFINMRAYLCSTAVYDALATTYWNNDSYPTDTTGETHPSGADGYYFSNGFYAPMWWPNPNNSADVIHLSRRTYVVYYKHIFKVMKALRYFE